MKEYKFNDYIEIAILLLLDCKIDNLQITKTNEVHSIYFRIPGKSILKYICFDIETDKPYTFNKDCVDNANKLIELAS